MTLAVLNECSKEKFVEAVGGVFEGCPWVAERAWGKRPFASFDDLSTRMIQAVQSASPDEQLALLRAQSGPDDGALSQPRREYRKKFGFPFLFAVRDSDSRSVAEALKRRMQSPPEQEFQVALGHAFRIARFRLEDIVP